MTKMFSPPYCNPKNPQELTRVTMQVYAGGTGSIRFQFRMNPVRNPAVFDCSINYHSFGSFSPGSNPDRDYECHANGIRQGVDAVLCYGLERDDAVRTGSVRKLIQN
jgi:hypothetical protein